MDRPTGGLSLSEEKIPLIFFAIYQLIRETWSAPRSRIDGASCLVNARYADPAKSLEDYVISKR